MDNITMTIGENIASLRKANNLTQQQLADRINYSNKAISRWEKGECLPSIETLCSLCEFFGVEFEYLIKPHEEPAKAKSKKPDANKIAILLLVCVSIFAVATLAFVYIKVFYFFDYWQVFVWGAPMCSLAAFWLSRRWWSKTVSLTAFSIFFWTLLGALYVTFLSYNIWAIFFVGIPVQVMAILIALIEREEK